MSANQSPHRTIWYVSAGATPESAARFKRLFPERITKDWEIVVINDLNQLDDSAQNLGPEERSRIVILLGASITRREKDAEDRYRTTEMRWEAVVHYITFKLSDGEGKKPNGIFVPFSHDLEENIHMAGMSTYYYDEYDIHIVGNLGGDSMRSLMDAPTTIDLFYREIFGYSSSGIEGPRQGPDSSMIQFQSPVHLERGV